MSVGVGNFSFALGVASISWCLAPDKYTDPANIAATVARVPQFQYSDEESRYNIFRDGALNTTSRGQASQL